MSGLLTGFNSPSSTPSSVAPSLIAVVQNALSHAWRILLKQVSTGDFSICGTEEDTITERLHMILGEIHASEVGSVSGFSLFETPVREGNLRNWNGDRLDCQPDLTFRPLRGWIPTTNTAVTGIFVECKPIDSRHTVSATYCQLGISRFIRGDYAWAVDRAIMLAYVRNKCPLPGGLAYVLDDADAKKNYKLQSALCLAGRTVSGDSVFLTVHDRDIQGVNSLINLHHLWLYPDKPCEQSRCRVPCNMEGNE